MGTVRGGEPRGLQVMRPPHANPHANRRPPDVEAAGSCWWPPRSECGSKPAHRQHRQVPIRALTTNPGPRWGSVSYSFPGIFVSCGCCNTLHTSWLETAHMHCFIVLDVRVWSDSYWVKAKVLAAYSLLEVPGEQIPSFFWLWRLPVLLGSRSPFPSKANIAAASSDLFLWSALF